MASKKTKTVNIAPEGEKRTQILTEIDHLISHELTYIDAIIHLSEKHNIDIESLASLVKLTPSLKSKIAAESVSLRLLK